MKKQYVQNLAILLAILVGCAAGYAIVQYRNRPVAHIQVPVTAPVDPETTTITRADLLKEVNAERAKNKELALIESSVLDSVAQAKADDEATNNYYAHTSPTGVKGDDLIFAEFPGVAGWADENLAAMNPGFTINTHDIFHSWMISPAHHAAMVDPHYTLTGFGWNGRYAVEDFFGPDRSKCPVTMCSDYSCSPSVGPGTCSGHHGELK